MYKGYDNETLYALLRVNCISNKNFADYCKVTRNQLCNILNNTTTERTLFFYSLALDKMLEEKLEDEYDIFGVEKSTIVPDINIGTINNLLYANDISFGEIAYITGKGKNTVRNNLLGLENQTPNGRKNILFYTKIISEILKAILNSEGYIFIPYKINNIKELNKASS